MLKENLEKIAKKNPSLSDTVPELEELILKYIERKKPAKVFISGSCATGDFVRGMSDIDIFMIVDEINDKDRFVLETVNNVNVELTLYTMREVERAMENKNQFVRKAVKGVVVYERYENAF